MAELYYKPDHRRTWKPSVSDNRTLSTPGYFHRRSHC